MQGNEKLSAALDERSSLSNQSHLCIIDRGRDQPSDAMFNDEILRQ